MLLCFLGCVSEYAVQKSKCLSLRYTTKQLSRPMGSQFCSFCLKIFDCVRHPRQKEYEVTSNRQTVCSAACQHVRPFSVSSCWISQIIAQPHRRAKPIGLDEGLCMIHHEGAVSLTLTSFSTLPTAVPAGDCPSFCLLYGVAQI